MSLLKSLKINSEIGCQLADQLISWDLPSFTTKSPTSWESIQTGISHNSPSYNIKVLCPQIPSSQGLDNLRQLINLVTVTRLVMSDGSR